MKEYVFFILAITASLSGFTQGVARAVSLSELQKDINTPSQRVKIYNFWATWCAPCIKELPEFEQAYRKKSAELVLVSLDYDLDPDPKKVNQFIQRKNITAPVYFLMANNSNQWIDTIYPSWSGAIPATLVVYPKTSTKKFIEGTIPEGELENIISLTNLADKAQ